MKLSSKFFCWVYIIVLLSTGFGEMFIIKKVNDTLWNTQLERVDTAVNYAEESFLVSYSEISGDHKNDIIRQIKDVLQGCFRIIGELHALGKPSYGKFSCFFGSEYCFSDDC